MCRLYGQQLRFQELISRDCTLLGRGAPRRGGTSAAFRRASLCSSGRAWRWDRASSRGALGRGRASLGIAHGHGTHRRHEEEPKSAPKKKRKKLQRNMEQIVCDAQRLEARRKHMQQQGYVYEDAIITPEEARAACADISRKFDEAGGVVKHYSIIQSAREQYKLGRDLDQLSPPVRVAVERVQERLERLLHPVEVPPLMDVYALRTAKWEDGEEARAPQRWHLDDYTKFPVAALVLSGTGATEFHTGLYADFSAGADGEPIEDKVAVW